MTEKKPLGRIQLKQQAVSPEQLEQLREQRAQRVSGATEVSEETDRLAALRQQSEKFGVPGLDLDQVCVKLSDLELLPREIAERHLILPVLSRGERLFVAMVNPREKKVIDELEFVTGKRVYPYVALEGALRQTVALCYARKAAGDEFYIGPQCPEESLRQLGVRRAVSEVPASISAASHPVPSSRSPSLTRMSEPSQSGAPSSSGASRESRPAPEPSAAPPPFPSAPSQVPAGFERDRGGAVSFSNELSLAPTSRFARPEDAVAPGLADSSLPDELEAPDFLRVEAPGITMSRAPSRQEVSEEDFGELSAELSVVSDLPVPEPGGADLSIPTILVVDDEAEIRRMLERLLAGKGYRVLQADGGQLALKMVKEHAPDLIVLDAMLPEIHGFDIARRIKGSKRYGHIPIVMVSAVYRGWHYAEDLKESCGVEAFIEKPFRISEVLSAVESALKGKPEAQPVDPEAMHQEAEAALHSGVAAYKEGRMEEAIEILKRGAEIDPLAYRLHFQLGLLYGKMGAVFEGIGALERAIEINARHFPAVKNLAILYQKAGFRNKAAEMWHKAAVIAPDEETREAVKQQLMALL